MKVSQRALRIRSLNMIEFPVVDSHVHLWDPQRFPISWLDSKPILNRPYQVTDFFEHSREVAVQAFVYVEVDLAPQYALLEAQAVASLAQSDSRVAGIVAAAPLEYGSQVRVYL